MGNTARRTLRSLVADLWDEVGEMRDDAGLPGAGRACTNAQILRDVDEHVESNSIHL